MGDKEKATEIINSVSRIFEKPLPFSGHDVVGLGTAFNDLHQIIERQYQMINDLKEKLPR